ncbi:GGDEF domain-containing response regulator [Thiocystis violascens]|uniref:diguanylate cyclase n=1 Tax=Thiocystis violascens (strain ATCC 17096 / DSM 198 / 6111) TaxID=765911 RepID=I3YDQ7_THIV6|nr:diguanylate cyclase [Thiocystis violascens]AFL75125.1 diguanylate cyclase (GGDEF) domain-containing protein [Thiocystis violascens DSM 198]
MIQMMNDATSVSATGTVLVVEDSRSLRGLLSAYLDDAHGLRTVEAGSLAEAEAALALDPTRFFAAVLDLNLPDAPEGEVVDLVQRHGIPVVVLTGSLDPLLRETMLSKQVVDYFVKHKRNEIEQVAHTLGRLWHNRQVKVMVVDDSPSFRAYLQRLLESYRYRTLTANNGREALKRLAEHPETSLVITDVNMPEMNGLELIEAIRQQYRREDLAVIGMSDASKPGLSARLLKAGANDFIAKPFQAEEFFCRVTQNTNMMEYVRRLREAATRDVLTGLANRRHALEVCEKLYANARRGHFQIALGMIDVDHFKQVNDRFGHLVGDDALKRIAVALSQSLRASDLVGRYGGEEFICLLVIKQDDDAELVLERVRAAVAQVDFEDGGTPIPLTVSIGFATELETSLLQMIGRADGAVYRAKAEGRNRVVRG